MRALNILSGVAALFTTLAFGHLLHHDLGIALHDAGHGFAFWAATAGAAVVGFSLSSEHVCC